MRCAVCRDDAEMTVAGFGLCVAHAAGLLLWLQQRQGSPVSWWVAQFKQASP